MINTPRLLFIFLVLSASASAQKLASGNLNGLKGVTSYTIKFIYDSMVIGDYMPEEKYLAQKKRDWEMKERGKGAAFIDQWFNDRQALYEPAFITNFEKYSDLELDDTNSEYTLIVKTQRTEGGWNIGIQSHPGEIEGEMWIVKSADPSQVIAKITFPKFRGDNASGGDFEMTWRISAAYAVAGRWLGNFIRKKTK
jgi:hypothetical protein